MLETKRLILRPWGEEDAETLYRYAKDPEVGPAAGWPPHTSVEESKHIIETVLSDEGTYAVVLKETMEPVGSAGLKFGEKSSLAIGEDEAEVGYWIAKDYWGRGLIPEAVEELLRYGFEELGLRRIWCGVFEGNQKSARVQEKCGFRYHHTEKDKSWPLIHAVLTEHFSCITEAEWRNGKKA